MKTVEILLIDDNPADARLVELAFHEYQRDTCKIKFSRVVSAESALKLLQCDELPDIIVLDLNLPGKSGFDFLTQVKQNPKTLYLPLVVLSTSESNEDIVSAYAMGANAYISKSVDFNEFSKKIAHFSDFWFCSATLPKYYEN